MTALGTRARVVLGVLVVVLLAVAGVLFVDRDGGGGSDPTVAASTAPTRTSLASTTPDASTPPRTVAADRTAAPSQTMGPRGVVPVPVSAAAWATLAEIDSGRWPGSANAPGTKGGDTWRNREGTLPRTDVAGARIDYREWDVNPKRRGETRDAERIVTGSDTSAWYTGDHYQSFVRMR